MRLRHKGQRVERRKASVSLGARVERRASRVGSEFVRVEHVSRPESPGSAS